MNNIYYKNKYLKYKNKYLKKKFVSLKGSGEKYTIDFSLFDTDTNQLTNQLTDELTDESKSILNIDENFRRITQLLYEFKIFSKDKVFDKQQIIYLLRYPKDENNNIIELLDTLIETYKDNTNLRPWLDNFKTIINNVIENVPGNCKSVDEYEQCQKVVNNLVKIFNFWEEKL